MIVLADNENRTIVSSFRWTKHRKVSVRQNTAVCIQGGSKKVSCWHSTTAYFLEPPCMSALWAMRTRC